MSLFFEELVMNNQRKGNPERDQGIIGVHIMITFEMFSLTEGKQNDVLL